MFGLRQKLSRWFFTYKLIIAPCALSRGGGVCSSSNFAGNFRPAEGQIRTFIICLRISELRGLRGCGKGATHEQNEICELRAGTACKNHAGQISTFVVWLRPMKKLRGLRGCGTGATHEQNEIWELRAGTACKNQAT